MAPVVVQENKERRNQARKPAQWVDQVSLSGAAASSYTVPANVDLIRIFFTAGALWMRTDGSAAVVPAGALTTGAGSEGVAQGDEFSVEPGQVLSFHNGTAAIVAISCKKCFVTG